MTTRGDMEAVVEAILFVSNDLVSREKLLDVFDEHQREEADQALESVLRRYRERPDRGFLIDEAAGGLRLVSRPDLHGYLRRFFEVSGSNKLSMPALETLAIVAYRQPVTGPEIAELRGVGSQGVLKTLLERRLVRVAGRKEVVGKPFLYATTREFLMHFGLRSLKELPPLEQFEELFNGDAEASAEGQAPDSEELADHEAAEIEAADDDQWHRRQEEEEQAQREEAEAAELPVDADEPASSSDDSSAETPEPAPAAGDETSGEGLEHEEETGREGEALAERESGRAVPPVSDEISLAEAASGDEGQDHEP